MVKKLIKFFSTTPYYYIKKVCDIEHSCLKNCSIEVLDFDLVKDDFFKNELQIGESKKLSSVDGIFYNTKGERLCLFDMKRYNKLNNQSEKEFIEQELSKMPKKIVDSLLILIAFLGYYAIDKTFYKVLLHPKQMPINSYMVINVRSQDLIGHRLALQDKLRISLSSRIEGNLGLISCEEFEQQFS